jgi:hypothetical protein
MGEVGCEKAVVQRRRRCTDVMTSTREETKFRSELIVVFIGVNLYLIGYVPCPLKTGCTPKAISGIPVTMAGGALEKIVCEQCVESRSDGRRWPK